MAIDWIKDYFFEWTQFVDYNGHYSSSRCISCSVPQGSILGPHFFSVIHLMNICHVCNLLDVILFTDYTNFLFSHNDPAYFKFHTINRD